MGSPIGATFCKVTRVRGVSPMSNSRHRSAPSPPTAVMTAEEPIFNSFNVIAIAFL